MKRLLLPLILSLGAPRAAEACAPAPPPGQKVIIAAEEALIAWDEKAHVEHFVRRAQFVSGAKDFGFLVPTPAPPTLAEADGAVFERLNEATRAEEKVETEIEPHLSCLAYFTFGATRGQSAAGVEVAVRVLSIEHVAGYEAAILQADDAEALRKWLSEHGYDPRPSLTEWLKPYVDQKWTVTAFKIADKSGAGRPASSAVRMTFPTARPFYPYREPTDQRDPADVKAGPPRTLRVFLVTGAGRQAGAVGAGPFGGQLRYARARAGLEPLLAGALPKGAVPDTAWLHDFVDESTPRPGTDDLFFSPAPAQTEVVPPPIVRVQKRGFFLPLDLVLVLGVGALWVVRLTRGRRPT